MRRLQTRPWNKAGQTTVFQTTIELIALHTAKLALSQGKGEQCYRCC